jgi:hypothetical protein
MMIPVDKEATDRRAMEEVVVKATADKEVTSKTVDEAVGAIGDSSAPDQAPSVAMTKRAVALSSFTPRAKRPYMGVWKPRFVQLSPLFFGGASFSDYISFFA